MGAGEAAGEGTLPWVPPGMGMGADVPVWGVLCDGAGEDSKPNWMPAFAPPTGPPFATYELGPLAAMVTELLREWSEEPLGVLPLATAGTAGVTDVFPFTGDVEVLLAFCAGDAEEPTTTGAWEPDVTRGACTGCFGAPAAEAYEAVVAELVAGMGFCWFADVIWESGLLRDGRRGDAKETVDSFVDDERARRKERRREVESVERF